MKLSLENNDMHLQCFMASDKEEMKDKKGVFHKELSKYIAFNELNGDPKIEIRSK